MKFSPLSFVVLFILNNLLHFISEKVIIIIFVLFLFFLMKISSDFIEKEFKLKISQILNDINIYIDVVFNFLYLNKLFYLNLKLLMNNLLFLQNIFITKLSSLLYSLILLDKLGKFKLVPAFLK